MKQIQTLDTSRVVGPSPRVAWCAEEPERPVEERLARVALAARAAALPAEVVLAAHHRTAPWPTGPASLHHLRLALADAAGLIARAPWEEEGELVTTTTGTAGVPLVVPYARAGGLDDPVYLHLELAAFVGLSDAPVDIRLLPLQLAGEDAAAADLRLDPTEYSFVGTVEAAWATRLWRYAHVATGRLLDLDADGRPWRAVGSADWVPWADCADAVRFVSRPRRRRRVGTR